MDATSREAGVSKATVYGHYPGKEELLAALVELAQAMVSTLMQPEYLALARIIIAETPRFPQLGELFRRTVPARGIEGVSEVLRRANEGGAAEVAEADLETAARMFGGTLLTYVLLDGLLIGDGPPRPPGPESVERAVKTYVKALV